MADPGAGFCGGPQRRWTVRSIRRRPPSATPHTIPCFSFAKVAAAQQDQARAVRPKDREQPRKIEVGGDHDAVILGRELEQIQVWRRSSDNSLACTASCLCSRSQEARPGESAMSTRNFIQAVQSSHPPSERRRMAAPGRCLQPPGKDTPQGSTPSTRPPRGARAGGTLGIGARECRAYQWLPSGRS